MTLLEGTEDVAPENGTAARARPALVNDEPEVTAEAGSTKQTRKRPTAEDIAQLKAWKAEGRTLAEIHELSGFSVGSIRKYTADAEVAPSDKPKRGRPPKVKSDAAPKARAVKAAPTVAASTARVDTVIQVKAMLFDLIAAGHPVAAIRGALASFPV